MNEITYEELTPIEQYSLLKIADGEQLHISDGKPRLLAYGLIEGSGIDFTVTVAGAKVIKHLRPKLKINE